MRMKFHLSGNDLEKTPSCPIEVRDEMKAQVAVTFQKKKNKSVLNDGGHDERGGGGFTASQEVGGVSDRDQPYDHWTMEQGYQATQDEDHLARRQAHDMLVYTMFNILKQYICIYDFYELVYIIHVSQAQRIL